MFTNSDKHPNNTGRKQLMSRDKRMYVVQEQREPCFCLQGFKFELAKLGELK